MLRIPRLIRKTGIFLGLKWNESKWVLMGIGIAILAIWPVPFIGREILRIIGAPYNLVDAWTTRLVLYILLFLIGYMIWFIYVFIIPWIRKNWNKAEIELRIKEQS